MPVGVALLGSTGSIGQSALAVLERHPQRFRLVSLAAHRNLGELEAQVARYRPEKVVLADPDGDRPATAGKQERWGFGKQALLDVAADPDVDIVINAIVGAAGLEVSLAVLREGKRLALANKESLVVGGPLLLQALHEGGGELVPIDSEHSAILQCLAAGRLPGGREGHEHSGAALPGVEQARRLILTASGGPFRDWDIADLGEVTPTQALRHPTWEMGAKISVDSASLANKALEVVEAHFLFGFDYDDIDVLLHPQSIIHSMVEMVDGSVLAQLGYPDMELPILYALSYPDRIPEPPKTFDLAASEPLSFDRLDPERFPAYCLGIEAGRAGGSAPVLFNAANEIAVSAFLAERLTFPGIAAVIDGVLQTIDIVPVDSLQTVFDADQRARSIALEIVRARC